MMISYHILCANIDAADKIEESAELITAAEIAPNPMVETNGGVKCCNTRGSIFDVWPQSSGVSREPLTDHVVFSQSVARAIAPIIIGGIDITTHPPQAAKLRIFA